MNQNEIRVLLALKDAPSLPDAARTLGISRTSVSRTLQNLEQRWHASFILHTPSGFRWTPTGALVLQTAEKIDKLTRELADDLHSPWIPIQLENTLPCWPETLYSQLDLQFQRQKNYRLSITDQKRPLKLGVQTDKPAKGFLKLADLNLLCLLPEAFPIPFSEFGRHPEIQAAAEAALRPLPLSFPPHIQWLHHDADWLACASLPVLIAEPHCTPANEKHRLRETWKTVSAGILYESGSLSPDEERWLAWMKEEVSWK